MLSISPQLVIFFVIHDVWEIFLGEKMKEISHKLLFSLFTFKVYPLMSLNNTKYEIKKAKFTY